MTVLPFPALRSLPPYVVVGFSKTTEKAPASQVLFPPENEGFKPSRTWHKYCRSIPLGLIYHLLEDLIATKVPANMTDKSVWDQEIAVPGQLITYIDPGVRESK